MKKLNELNQVTSTLDGDLLHIKRGIGVDSDVSIDVKDLKSEIGGVNPDDYYDKDDVDILIQNTDSHTDFNSLDKLLDSPLKNGETGTTIKDIADYDAVIFEKKTFRTATILNPQTNAANPHTVTSNTGFAQTSYSYDAYKAFDQVYSTAGSEWAPDMSTVPTGEYAYAQIEFITPITIDAFYIKTRTISANGDSYIPNEWSIDYKDESGAWINIIPNGNVLTSGVSDATNLGLTLLLSDSIVAYGYRINIIDASNIVTGNPVISACDALTISDVEYLHSESTPPSTGGIITVNNIGVSANIGTDNTITVSGMSDYEVVSNVYGVTTNVKNSTSHDNITKVSELENDENFISSNEEISEDSEFEVIEEPIPTKMSELKDDVGFVTIDEISSEDIDFVIPQ